MTLWEVQSGILVRTFTGKAKPVFKVCFAPDGKRAYSNGKDSALKRWDLATGAVTRLAEGSGKGSALASVRTASRHCPLG